MGQSRKPADPMVEARPTLEEIMESRWLLDKPRARNSHEVTYGSAIFISMIMQPELDPEDAKLLVIAAATVIAVIIASLIVAGLLAWIA